MENNEKENVVILSPILPFLAIAEHIFFRLKAMAKKAKSILTLSSPKSRMNWFSVPIWRLYPGFENFCDMAKPRLEKVEALFVKY